MDSVLSAIFSAMLFVLQVLGLFLASTVVFDAVHWLLHVFLRSPSALLRALGSPHATHHRFLDRDLRIHPELIGRNLLHHVVPEYATQMGVSVAALWIFPVSVVLCVMAIQTLVFAMILRDRGLDINHRELEGTLPAYRPMFFCLPPYHALHHVHPDSYFSSWIKLLDYGLGSGAELRHRRVAVSGADTGFGAAVAEALEADFGCDVARLEGGELGAGLASRLGDREILILCHGLGGEGVVAGPYAEVIRRFAAATSGRRLPAEVWGVGLTSGASAREFAPHARRYYDDPRLSYRHFLLSPEEVRRSEEPRGAEALVRRLFFWARRGAHFLPPAGLLSWLPSFLRFRFRQPRAAGEGAPRL